MKKSGTARSDIFYTTKLKENLGYDHAKRAIKKSLKLAGLDHMYGHLSCQCHCILLKPISAHSDLYLIHGPHPSTFKKAETQLNMAKSDD